MMHLKKILSEMITPFQEKISSDIEDAGRRRLFSIFLLFLIPPLIIFGINLIKQGLYRYGILDCILSLVFVYFLILIKRIKNPGVLYRIVLILLLLLLFYWINTGAINGYASIWALGYPLFAFYLMGKKEGLFWTLVVLVMTIMHFLIPQLSFTGFVYKNDFTARHLFSFVLIIIFTYNYESMRERFKNAMEAEQKKLNEEKDRLDEIVAERTGDLEKSNAMLASSEAKYRLMADNITDMIWTADLNMQFTFISPSVYRIFGYTVAEAMDLPFDRWNTPESFARVIKLFITELEKEKNKTADPNRYVNAELEHVKADGTIVPVEVTVSFLRDRTGEAIGIVGITRDISERKKAEEENSRIQQQLSQAQKMEAIGTLVGGIAHDFNNILGGIIGSFDLVSRLLDEGKPENREKIKRYLNIGMESSLRSAELIKQLLALSRRHEISLSPVDITDSLNHVVEICRNSLSKTVEIDYVKPDVPLVIMGDMVQIEQVLLNLCINSAHAMTIMIPSGEKEGGILKLRAAEVRSDSIMKELYPEILNSPGTWAKIEISDTGVGIEPEDQKRIFEPFFTTKKQEQGSGLGLAISYNIIHQHKGIIHVYSEPGKGTIFTIYLPLYRTLERIDVTGDTGCEILKGSGTILIIDDEPVMLSIGKGFLEECGYSVFTASSGIDGIDIYKKNNNEISAVLMDLSMPGMSGLEVFLELKKINEKVKVLLASGMLTQESLNSAEKIGIKGTVTKPYLSHELSCRIKEIIAD